MRWYEHNDLEDMERVLKSVVKEQEGRALTRRFIVTEGLFENVGDMLDLPRVVRFLFPLSTIPSKLFMYHTVCLHLDSNTLLTSD